MKKMILTLIICFVFLTGCTSQPTLSEAEPDESAITLADLSTYDGQTGNKCYVGVSGKVYEITDSEVWTNGVHTESNRLARCGEDLTDVISESPHGISILTTSPKVREVGSLEK